MMLAVAWLWPARAQDTGNPNDSVALAWNAALLQAVREAALGPPIVARSLAIVHGCMYEGWAVHEERIWDGAGPATAPTGHGAYESEHGARD